MSPAPRDKRPKGAADAGAKETEHAARVAEFLRSQFRYELRDVPRSKINPAAYNPRLMPDANQRRLRASLAKTGFVAPPFVWNEATGNLVSGHQRLKSFDAAAKKAGLDPMTLTIPNVSVVRIDALVEEKALNYQLNNPNTQGVFDLGLTQELFKTEGLDLATAGLDIGEVRRVLGTDATIEAFPEEMAKVGDDLQSTREGYFESSTEVQDMADAYLVIVFESKRVTDEFMDAMGLDKSSFVVSADVFLAMREALDEARAEIARLRSTGEA